MPKINGKKDKLDLRLHKDVSGKKHMEKPQ